MLAVAVTKGGTGKTTSSVALATELAREVDVVLMDADTQGQAAHALGLARGERGSGLAGALGGDGLDEAMRTAPAEGQAHRSRLHVLSGSAGLASEAARMSADPAAGLLAMRDVAVAAAAHVGAPVVLIDTPPGWGPLSLGALAAADAVFAPFPPHALAVEALATFDGHLASVQRTRQAFGGAALPRLAYVLPTMVPARGIAPAAVLEALGAWAAGHRDAPTLLEPVPRSVRVEEAPSFGLSVPEHAPTHKAAEAYRVAARAVLAEVRARAA